MLRGGGFAVPVLLSRRSLGGAGASKIHHLQLEAPQTQRFPLGGSEIGTLPGTADLSQGGVLFFFDKLILQKLIVSYSFPDRYNCRQKRNKETMQNSSSKLPLIGS